MGTYSIDQQYKNNQKYMEDDHIPYVDAYETKARLIGEKLEIRRQETAKSSEATRRKLFDMLYGDWTPFEIKRHWEYIPYDYQKEYERRKELAKTYDQLYDGWSEETIQSKIKTLPEDHREEYYRRKELGKRLDEITQDWPEKWFDDPNKVNRLPHGCQDELVRRKKRKANEHVQETDEKKPIKVIVKVHKKRDW